MTSMNGNILNRVRRLPKPSNASEALQPIFEAVSNAIHAIEDIKKADPTAVGSVEVSINNIRSPQDIDVIISDNGIGLNQERYDAFITTDTDFKLERGGKGIGRLLWLDAFNEIKVTSVFSANDKKQMRKFRFVLDASDQITDELLEDASSPTVAVGTIIAFKGLRGTTYQSKFPGQASAIIRQFGSHFLAEFILGNSPKVSISIGKTQAEFPRDIENLLTERRGSSTEETPLFGKIKIDHFIFHSAASAGFDGNHQLHFIANGRTVLTRKIDGLVGIGRIGINNKDVYHGCVTAEFLNDRVNQERTHFNFDENTLEQIAKVCAEFVLRDAIAIEAKSYDDDRLVTMVDFVKEYPSFGYAPPDYLLAQTPKNATKAEQFAQSLITTRIRRDIDRKQRVQSVINAIESGHELTGDFSENVRRAADDVKAEEQRQLTEYVLRRKMVLDVLDVLIKRLRAMPDGTEDHYLEETLHKFICPMKLRGDDPTKVVSTDHDLWVIDERLAFTRYFASDVPVGQIISDSKVTDRPDVFIWDHVHGLGVEGDEPLRRVMLIEFKKPGRKDYDDKYSPQNQIARYLNALANGKIETFDNQRVRVAHDCVYHCYVVADIVGNLETYTSMWRTTADGRGRWIELSGKFRGSIEVIEWRDLVSDARARNAAFIQLT